MEAVKRSVDLKILQSKHCIIENIKSYPLIPCPAHNTCRNYIHVLIKETYKNALFPGKADLVIQRLLYKYFRKKFAQYTS